VWPTKKEGINILSHNKVNVAALSKLSELSLCFTWRLIKHISVQERRREGGVHA